MDLLYHECEKLLVNNITMSIFPCLFCDFPVRPGSTDEACISIPLSLVIFRLRCLPIIGPNFMGFSSPVSEAKSDKSLGVVLGTQW